MGRRHIENYIGEYVLYTPPVQPQLAVLVAYEGRPHEAGKYTIQLVKGGRSWN